MSFVEILQSYDISSKGFLPEIPIPLLTHNQEWESFVEKLPLHNRNGNTREEFVKLPKFDLDLLKTDKEYKRAYVILSMVANAYIFCTTPLDVLPEKVAVPLWRVSEKLGISPVLTHATVDLWNWHCTDGDFCVDNLKARSSMTGTKDEEWFYMIMVAIEGHCGTILKFLVQLTYDRNDLVSKLEKIRDILKKICEVVQRMSEHCNPDFFYNKLRPYLSGSKGNDALPNGLIYEGISEKPQQFYGGSAAESTLFQVLDIVFGIAHASNYFIEIRKYMPEKHRSFLNFIMKLNLDQLVRDDPEAEIILHECVATLKRFRQLHYNLVTMYILKQMPNNQNKAKGTGGTELQNFLKEIIRETK